MDNNNEELFYKYYEGWVAIYKEGAVRKVTLDKSHLTYAVPKRWHSLIKKKSRERISTFHVMYRPNASIAITK